MFFSYYIYNSIKLAAFNNYFQNSTSVLTPHYKFATILSVHLKNLIYKKYEKAYLHFLSSFV